MSEYVIFWRRHPWHSHGAPQGAAAPTLRKAALHDTLEIGTISLNVALSYVFKQSLTRWRFNHRESVPQSSYDQKPAAAHKQTP